MTDEVALECNIAKEVWGIELTRSQALKKVLERNKEVREKVWKAIEEHQLDQDVEFVLIDANKELWKKNEELWDEYFEALKEERSE